MSAVGLRRNRLPERSRPIASSNRDDASLRGHFVRTATKSDLPLICVIEDGSFPDPYPPALMERLQHDYSDSFFVVENASGKLVGYCVASDRGGVAHLISIGVLREHRRKGAGAALLKTLLEWSKVRRVDELWLEVNAENGDAIKFYEQFGFGKIMVLENYYADGSPALRMRLRMKNDAREGPGRGRGRKA